MVEDDFIFRLENMRIAKIIQRPSSHIKSPYVSDIKLLNKKTYNLDEDIIIAHTPALGCCGLTDTNSFVFVQPISKVKKCSYRVCLSILYENQKNIFVGTNPVLGELVTEYCLQKNYFPTLSNIKSYKKQTSGMHIYTQTHTHTHTQQPNPKDIQQLRPSPTKSQQSIDLAKQAISFNMQDPVILFDSLNKTKCLFPNEQSSLRITFSNTKFSVVSEMEMTQPQPLDVQQAPPSNAIDKNTKFEYTTQDTKINIHSRFDFSGIDENNIPFILEVKNVPLADDINSFTYLQNTENIENTQKGKTAYFPDGYRKNKNETISPRALKHIQELTLIKKKSNIRCILCFVIQRNDVNSMTISDKDPIYKNAIIEAINSNVEIICISVEWKPNGCCYLYDNNVKLIL